MSSTSISTNQSTGPGLASWNPLVRWRLMPKFILQVGVLCFPLALLMYFFVTENAKQGGATNSEITGVQYLRPLASFQHAVISGSPEQANTHFAATEQRHREYGESLRDNEQWNKLSAAVKAMKAASGQELETARAAVGTEVRNLVARIGDTSNLILDPDLDSFYLMDINVVRMPVLLDDLATIRATVAAAANGLSSEARRTLERVVGKSYTSIEDTVRDLNVAIENNGDLKTELLPDMDNFSAAVTAYLKLVEERVLNPQKVEVTAGELGASIDKAVSTGAKSYHGVLNALDRLLEARASRIKGVQHTVVGLSMAALLASLLFAFFLVRSIVRPLRSSITTFKQIADGELGTKVAVDERRDEVGELMRCLDAMQTQLRHRAEEEHKATAEMLRIQQALDGATANVMVADADGNIIYMNRAVTQTLRNAQEDIRKDLPAFNVDRLVGLNIDSFHKNPAHQRNLLQHLRDIYRTRIQVGPRKFDLIAAPVFDGNGVRLGTSVEWADVTEQLRAEEQVNGMIYGVVEGRLDWRIEVDTFEAGFMKTLAEGINKMLDAFVGPFQNTVSALKQLAEGDLTARMDGDYKGEYAALSVAVNTCTANLQNMVGEIRSAAESIGTASREIAQGNGDLSARTEQQASSLQETASSMEELTGTVKQNADNARQANQLAASARDQAERGGDVVGRAVGAMSEINTASKKIADIIGVIDEIAFQTNLLALNAAVEAARAGEQGRGFAVVAAEVRNLAQRSAGAAREIKGLIGDSVAKVDEGSKLVDESGSTLGTIVQAVKKVSDIIAEIAAASAEQSSGIEQVNKAIAQMDQVTQQNAALVEEAAAASEAMREQAEKMSDLMAFFRVNESAPSVGVTETSAQPTAERRSAKRPWSGKEAAGTRKESAASAPKPTKKAATSGSVDAGEWEEF